MNLVYAKFGHNHLSDWLIFVMPIVVIQFLRAKKRRKNIVWGLLTFFFLISFFLTFARGALLVLSLVFLLILRIYRPGWKKLAVLAPLALVPGITIVSLMIYSFYKSGDYGLSDQTIKRSWFLRQTLKHPANEARFEYWRQAAEGFKLRPIKGNGPGTFKLTSKRFQTKPKVTSWFAHNNLLQVLSEVGVLGLITFLGLLLLSFRQLRDVKVSGENFILMGLILGELGSFLQALVDFNFDFLAIQLLFWVLLTAVLASRGREKALFYKPVSASIVVFSVTLFTFSLLSAASSVFLVKAEEAKRSSDILLESRFRQKSVSVFPFSQIDWVAMLEAEDDQAFYEGLANKAFYFNREDGQILSNFASFLKLQGEMRGAQKLYERLMVLEPNNKTYPLELFVLSLEEKGLYQALDYLIAVASIEIKLQAKLYPKLVESQPAKITLPDDNTQLIELFLRFLSSTKVESLTQPHSANLAKVFYELGLISYLSFEPSLSENLWLTAVYLAPEWSYFHIELANLYLLTENIDAAKAQLESCLRFYHPKDYCRQYLVENLEANVPQEAGFLENEVRQNIGQ